MIAHSLSSRREEEGYHIEMMAQRLAGNPSGSGGLIGAFQGSNCCLLGVGYL